MLSHMPPGVDVVCYSNGQDYVKGMRHALVQAKAGRVAMVVDCTYLLNLRHLHDRVRAWEFPYPDDTTEFFSFNDIRRCNKTNARTTTAATKVAVVSYGNGVVREKGWSRRRLGLRWT